MNIQWNIHMSLSPSCGSLSVLVTPNDCWEGVKLSRTKLRALKGIYTADLIKDGRVFKDIPMNWFMIEN